MGSYARVSLFALVTTACAGVAVAVTGCSSGDESLPSSQTTPRDANGGSSLPAVEGSNDARTGLGVAAGTPTTGDSPQSRYAALVEIVLQRLEASKPGTLAAFGAELRTDDVQIRVRAMERMRADLAVVVESPELEAQLAKDKRFASNVSPTGLFGSDSVSLRDISRTGVCGEIPNLGKGADGLYGDGSQGIGSAFTDLGGLFATDSLSRVDSGTDTPDPSSRLGAYAATRGYPKGSVGEAVHNAIGTIYVALGTYGEEKIGRVFNDPRTIALYNDPVDSASGLRVAEIEELYWNNVAQEEGITSGGGFAGSLFDAKSRDRLQRRVFGNYGTLDGGAGCPGATVDSCTGKADGLYCSSVDKRSAFQCSGGSIRGAEYCEQAGQTCSGPNGAGTTIACQ